MSLAAPPETQRGHGAQTGPGAVLSTRAGLGRLGLRTRTALAQVRLRQARPSRGLRARRRRQKLGAQLVGL
eukprot:460617-Alexandrium_andersonii.AAC.1